MEGRSGLIQEEPVEAELAGGFAELDEVHRLTNVAIGAEALAVDAISFLVARSEDNDREKFGTFVAVEATKNAQPVEFGEFQVEENHRERPAV